ncbi:hypothetical protein ACOTD8_20340 [Achromobacter dolens]|uniref:hypothetical protein n=1 Tax=Achromobacter dolens TaxID=1287738 RepID=UPI003B9B75E4
MPWIEIALPGVLLLVKFFVKLTVDRSASLPDFISAMLALPVDVVFLSASLTAAHVISSPHSLKEGVPIFAACLGLSLLIVFIWRRSESQFTKDRYATAGSLGLFNVLLSSCALIYSLSLLTAGGDQ